MILRSKAIMNLEPGPNVEASKRGTEAAGTLAETLAEDGGGKRVSRDELHGMPTP